MRLKLANIYFSWHIISFLTIVLGLNLSISKSYANTQVSVESNQFQAKEIEPNLNLQFPRRTSEEVILSKTSVLPEAIELVKSFEGFRSNAYIDSSGLPVIGYGQTVVNGRTAQLGQFISQDVADRALEQELGHIQRLVTDKIKVDLNPYQLGALTSLVYNAGTVVITNSTLARKLNAGDYIGAANEFVRWNKANRGGELVEFPGLTKRRLAEQKLFLTPYGQLASNN